MNRLDNLIGKNIYLHLDKYSYGYDSSPGYYYSIWLKEEHMVIGHAEFHPSTMEDFAILGNIGLEIDEEYRHLGYGKETIYLLFQLAKLLHYEEIIITTRKNNDSCIHFIQTFDSSFLKERLIPEDSMYSTKETNKLLVYKLRVK